MLRIANGYDKDKEGIRKSARVLLFQALKMGTESMALTKEQTDILKAQQGHNYVPFLTRDLNGAIANQIASQKPVMELLKLLQDKSPALLVPIKDESGPATQQYMTTDNAVKLIRDNSHSVLESPEVLKGLLTDKLPDINPNTQDLSQIQIPVELKDKPTKRKLSQYTHGSRDNQGSIMDGETEEDFKA